MNRSKLTPAEVKRLKDYIKKVGDQQAAGESLGVDASTLSRALNGHTAPSPLLTDKLVEVGVIIDKTVAKK